MKKETEASLIINKTKFIVAIIMATIFIGLGWRYHNETIYIEAIGELKEGHYEEALELLYKIENYKDAEKLIGKAENYMKYNKAVDLFNGGNYDAAKKIFKKLGDFEDSEEYLNKSLLPEIGETQEETYEEGQQAYKRGDYWQAKKLFELLGNYYDSKDYAEKSKERIAKKLAYTISAGSYSAFGITNGMVLSTGQNEYGQKDVQDWNNMISIDTRGYYTIGLCEDLTVRLAGNIEWSNSIDVSDWKDIVQVSAGARYVVGLKGDGTVCWDGYDDTPGTLDFSDWTNIVQIASGWHTTVGLTSEGELKVTGRGADEITSNIKEKKDSWKNLKYITVGGTSEADEVFVAGITENDDVVFAGAEQLEDPDLSSWHNIKSISADEYHLVALNKDEQVLSIGIDKYNPEKGWTSYVEYCQTSEWENIVEVTAGLGTTIAVDDTGKAYSVGYDKQQQRPKDGAWNDITIYEEWWE